MEKAFIRHGEKSEVEEKRKPIEESGLTEEQQKKWKEAVEDLKLEDPELKFEALAEIEKLAETIFKELPLKATLVFVSSDTARTNLTRYLLSGEITKLNQENDEKDIRVASLVEPFYDAEDWKKSLKGNLIADMMDLIDEVRKADFADDEMITKYFEEGGNKSIPQEQELTMKAANMDLARGSDSYLRKRGEHFRKQLEEIEDEFSDLEPIYFFGITHHSSLIALDAEFNGRESYENVKEIPEPLALWKARESKK